MRTLGLLLTVASLLAGCATVPMAGTGADAEGKRLDPPPPGRSALYVYRSSMLGTEAIFNIADNQQPVGALADRTWIRVDVAPGPHVVACSIQSYAPLTQDPALAATVTLAPGETRFVEAVIWPGLPLNPRCRTTEVAPDQGRAAVAAGNRAMGAGWSN